MSAANLPSLKRLAGSLQKHVKKTGGSKKPTTLGATPKVRGGENPLKFAERVQSYLLQLNPAVQVDAMNKIQENTPFMLIDPLRPREVNKIVYGHYDLINFLLNRMSAKPGSDDTFYHPSNFTREALIMNKILAMQEDLKPSKQAESALQIISELEKLNLSHNDLIKHPAYKLVYRIYDSLKRPQYLPVRTKAQASREKHYLQLVQEFHERATGKVPSMGRDKKFIGNYFDVGADIDHVPKSQQKKLIKLLN
jgi:hypothetical protein